MNDTGTAARLEYLRDQIRAARISYGEIAELQSLAGHISPGDTELLEWAGVPEHATEPDMIIVPDEWGWSLLVNNPDLSFNEALIASAADKCMQGLFDLAAELEGTVELRDEG